MGSSTDAQNINLGLDYDYANDIMIKTVAESNGDGPRTIYFARALGATVNEARDGLTRLLSSPERLKAKTDAWWNQYLNEVPHLDVPDESFAKTFLWSWPNFRMNRIEVPMGKVPAGLFPVANCNLKARVVVSYGDRLLAEAMQLLHDTQPARDTMLFLLRESPKHGLLRRADIKGTEDPANYANWLANFSGLVFKYLLTIGDLGLLDERIDGMTFLERIEGALEAQLAFRDEDTGLFWTDGEMNMEHWLPKWTARK